MTLEINDDFMALKISDRVIATARFDQYAAGAPRPCMSADVLIA